MDGFQSIYYIALLLGPILGSIIISLLNLITDREIPPILPQINSQSFGQAIVAITATAIISQVLNPVSILTGLIVLLALFLVLLMHTWIEKRQIKKTQDHVARTLEEKVKDHLAIDVNIETLKQIAQSMVDVDFFPNSITNSLSEFPRRARRELFVKLINQCVNSSDSIQNVKINEEELLVPEDQRKGLNFFYIFISVASFLLYIVSIVVLISVTSS